MQKTVANIMTNSDIERINAYIRKKQEEYSGDDCESTLLRAIYGNIKEQSIPCQLVVYTVMTTETKQKAANSLGVSVQTIINYTNKWLKSVRENKQIRRLYTEYLEWDAENEKNNNEGIFYFIKKNGD